MSKQRERHLRMSNDKEAQKEQFFTRPEYLREFADLIASKMREGDCFVDCSCGTGELGVLLNRKGFKVQMFDIDDSFLMEEARPHFTLKDWLETTRDDIPEASGYVVGFNPPYGTRSKTAKLFINHASKLFPMGECHHMFFLIMYAGDLWRPQKYVLESSQTYQSSYLFYDPTWTGRVLPSMYGVVLNVYRWSMIPESRPSNPQTPHRWFIKRLHYDKQNTREPYDNIKLMDKKWGEGRVILLRVVGIDAGQAARWWDSHLGQFVFFNKKGETICEHFDNTFPSLHYSMIVIPPEYAFKREIVVSKLNPILSKLRYEKGRKQGVTVKEITWAINQIDWG